MLSPRVIAKVGMDNAIESGSGEIGRARFAIEARPSKFRLSPQAAEAARQQAPAGGLRSTVSMNSTRCSAVEPATTELAGNPASMEMEPPRRDSARSGFREGQAFWGSAVTPACWRVEQRQTASGFSCRSVRNNPPRKASVKGVGRNHWLEARLLPPRSPGGTGPRRLAAGVSTIPSGGEYIAP